MIYNSFLYITLFPFLFLLLHAIKKEAIKKYFCWRFPMPYTTITTSHWQLYFWW